MHLLHYLHLLKLLKEKDKMKIVRKHLKLNRELMYEYLRINTELFNQEKITCLNNEIRSVYDDNESEFNEIVLNISDNNMKLRVFLMDIYVNGFKNISFVLRQNRNIKDEKNLSELDKQYLNMEHGIRTICRDIETYLFVNYKIKLSEIDYNKYNISQKYVGSFELSKPTESNATKKEPQQEKYEIILSKLNEYKFNELEKVGNLDLKIVKHICTQSIPYKVAYLDYLGFIKHLESYTNKGVEIHKLLAEILDTTNRSIKGNINVLNPRSKENKTRYTAHKHNKNIKEHYQLLK